jgi:hypothetical protein
MLSPEEKDRIKALETYRIETLEEILEKKTPKSNLLKILKIFDSKIGIWILSAAFTWIGAKTYSDYQVKLQQEYKYEEIVEKLDLEIGHKFNRFFSAIDLVVGDIEKLSPDSLPSKIAQVQKLALGFDKKQSFDSYNLYPEYANRSVLSLMLEQKRVLLKLGTKDPELDRVIANAANLPAFFARHQNEVTTVAGIQSLVKREMVLPRWEDYGIR